MDFKSLKSRYEIFSSVETIQVLEKEFLPKLTKKAYNRWFFKIHGRFNGEPSTSQRRCLKPQ
jgi:hypothetical protein